MTSLFKKEIEKYNDLARAFERAKKNALAAGYTLDGAKNAELANLLWNVLYDLEVAYDKEKEEVRMV